MGFAISCCNCSPPHLAVDVLGRIGYIAALENTPPVQPPDPAAEKPLTLPERLLFLLTAPRRLFGELPFEPHRPSNWIVPWVILSLTMIISGVVMLTHESLMGQISQIMEETLRAATEDGAFSAEDVEWQMRLVGPGSPIFAFIWIAGPAAAALVTIFALAFFYSLIGRSAMNAHAPFMKVVEVVGLTSLVRALETLVTLGCVLLTGSILATPSAALVLETFDPASTLHFALSRLNPFTFWALGVTALGLAELFERDFPKVFVLILALWFLWNMMTLLFAI